MGEEQKPEREQLDCPGSLAAQPTGRPRALRSQTELCPVLVRLALRLRALRSPEVQRLHLPRHRRSRQAGIPHVGGCGRLQPTVPGHKTFFSGRERQTSMETYIHQPHLRLHGRLRLPQLSRRAPLLHHPVFSGGRPPGGGPRPGPCPGTGRRRVDEGRDARTPGDVETQTQHGEDLSREAALEGRQHHP